MIRKDYKQKSKNVKKNATAQKLYSNEWTTVGLTKFSV